MFGFGNLTWILTGILVALAMAFGAYFWYAQHEIGTLTENNAKLEESVKTQKETIDKMEQLAQQQRISYAALERSSRSAETKYREAQLKLNQLGLRANAKNNSPGLQDAINLHIGSLYKELELESGAEKK